MTDHICLKLPQKFQLVSSCIGQYQLFNSLTNDKILEWTKLKAFANDNFDVAKIIIST